ncbi:MAG: short chain dehydrogenase [Gammaproteobacteria bacterium]
MKILIIGGTGTIGKILTNSLLERHTVITAGLSQGDFQVDIADIASIRTLYQRVGTVDAVVVTTGKVAFAPLTKMTAEQYAVGLQNKLMGQVNVVLQGIPYLSEGGSFTLTSGIINESPIRTGSSASMVNGALESFVKAAAIELPHQLRINIVSPTVLEDSLSIYGDYFRGFEPVSAAKVALAYCKSIEGAQTGQVYRAGW